ncbi:hypothetical protein [uncultured Winogradskyella sp.]|uniref:hypothetical protein n=1 Tax=uncultured Winogradskyella sp. TaxID=395353 RepID=UPI003519550E
MKKESIFVLMFFLLVTVAGSAQEKRDIDNSKTTAVSDIYRYSQDVTSFLQIAQIEGFGNLNIPQDAQNVAIIRQVGVGNTATIESNSETSDIRHLQVGINNNIESINTINNFSEQVIQLGINNEYIHDSFGNITSSGLNIIQTGNNLNFQKVGSNSQTRDMTVRMSGQERTVIVRSN